MLLGNSKGCTVKSILEFHQNGTLGIINHNNLESTIFSGGNFIRFEVPSDTSFYQPKDLIDCYSRDTQGSPTCAL